MSELFREPSDSDFTSHPCTGLFMTASYDALDATGSARIPNELRWQLMGQFGLGEGETAALAYLAAKWVEEAQNSISGLDQELRSFSLGEL